MTDEVSHGVRRRRGTRAGHHCAQPILRRFGVESSVRASLALYNTHADVEALALSVRRIRSAAAGLA
jgi:cysteine desulfurase / selenocysteine lyase